LQARKWRKAAGRLGRKAHIKAGGESGFHRCRLLGPIVSRFRPHDRATSRILKLRQRPNAIFCGKSMGPRAGFI
jgi:hypothetical protein